MRFSCFLQGVGLRYGVLKHGERSRALIRIRNKKIDLEKITQADSSGLALLSAWVRYAKSQSKEISIHNVPRFLSDMVRVSGMDAVFPIVLR